jgi:hypothetical protein
MRQYIHHVAGRLRLKFPQLKNRPSLVATTEAAILKLRGVTSAEVNIITGSLLIRYDPRNTNSEILLAALNKTFKQLGLSSTDSMAHTSHSQVREQAPAVRNNSSQHSDMLLNMLIEKCIERSVVVVLGALL